MSILVTGGAGYIGSVTVELLRSRGERVVVIDSLARGHRGALPPDVPFYRGPIGDSTLAEACVRRHQVDCAIHLAAFACVGESVAAPARYLENNLTQGIRLLRTLARTGVDRVVFSSSCATYGEAVRLPIGEDHPQEPSNPYGWTKLLLERVLESLDSTSSFRYVALRYFNAAGATVRHGEHHEPETHLIPNTLAAAAGLVPVVPVFGDSYPTRDGTAVRDYVHVADIATAHVLALEHLRRGGASECLNLGTGQGFSVQEVVDAARRVTGRRIPVSVEPPRSGDPPALFASSAKARSVLGWNPVHTGIETMIETAWRWRCAHPNGYPA